MLTDKVVVVTGGTGSLGKTLVKRILQQELGAPRKVIVFSRDEAKQHFMRLAFANMKTATDEVIYHNFERVLEFRIGDVRHYADVCSVLRNADVVINAAALKQVPTCEYFPGQALQTNCLGAMNIVRAIEENHYPVKVVVGVSTDKAAKPINTMGMTKALQERIFISANIQNPDTRFVVVRYGNVLASRGSVIPLFHQQILQGKPLTITTPDMTRFLLSIDAGVDTIFFALQHAHPGEMVIPRIPSANMVNVARALIADRPIDIQYSGIRPGEKIHEILISDEEAQWTTARGDYYIVNALLPEMQLNFKRSDVVLKKEYSSSDHVLDLDGTRDLLARYDLLTIRNIEDFVA